MTRERLEVGAVLDRKYKLVRRLGEGGMGTVFEAEHLKIRGRVAIKVLHEQLSQRGDSVRRFVQEARAAGTIGHPGIVPVIDMGGLEPGKQPYIVMELLRGANLSRLMAFYGPLNPETVACVVLDVLGALSAAHAQHIVHRDLKPDNVFVAIEGSEVSAKVVDFGVSKFMHESRTSGLTQTGTVMGTPSYMSPEQARGEKHLDGRVDVYAAGVIFYEALCGEPPFQSDNYNALLQAIIAAPVEPIRRRRPDVPVDLEAVIFRAMARDLGERFATVDDMSRALLEVLDPASLRRARRGLLAAVTELPGDVPEWRQHEVSTLDDPAAEASPSTSPPSVEGGDEEPTNLFIRAIPRNDERSASQRPSSGPPSSGPPSVDDPDGVSGRFRTIRGLDDLDAASGRIITAPSPGASPSGDRLPEDLDAASGRVRIAPDDAASRARTLARRRSHPDLSAGRATFAPPMRTPEAGKPVSVEPTPPRPPEGAGPAPRAPTRTDAAEAAADAARAPRPVGARDEHGEVAATRRGAESDDDADDLLVLDLDEPADDT
ncbi:MAG: protein kinase [Deltaproteobacteria bacterium]|nr:protein kinase [Deltaproteobacteria bacterium]